jgi:hypothetical protein
MKMYVAVVTKACELSGRPEGDWASFVNKNQKDAVAAAMKARSKWEAKGFGPYKILVGVLTQEVNVPVKFELAPITEKTPAVMIPVGQSRDAYYASRYGQKDYSSWHGQD